MPTGCLQDGALAAHYRPDRCRLALAWPLLPSKTQRALNAQHRLLLSRLPKSYLSPTYLSPTIEDSTRTQRTAYHCRLLLSRVPRSGLRAQVHERPGLGQPTAAIQRGWWCLGGAWLVVPPWLDVHAHGHGHVVRSRAREARRPSHARMDDWPPQYAIATIDCASPDHRTGHSTTGATAGHLAQLLGWRIRQRSGRPAVVPSLV